MTKAAKVSVRLKTADGAEFLTKGEIDDDVAFALWMVLSWGETPNLSTPEGRAMARFLTAMKKLRNLKDKA